VCGDLGAVEARHIVVGETQDVIHIHLRWAPVKNVAADILEGALELQPAHSARHVSPLIVGARTMGNRTMTKASLYSHFSLCLPVFLSAYPLTLSRVRSCQKNERVEGRGRGREYLVHRMYMQHTYNIRYNTLSVEYTCNMQYT